MEKSGARFFFCVGHTDQRPGVKATPFSTMTKFAISGVAAVTPALLR